MNFKKILVLIRNFELKKDNLTFGVVDAKSIENVDTAKEKGYNAGKKYPVSSCIL